MKVIICGAGQVGWQIARHLSGENNDVTVVDFNADLVRRATDTLDVQGIVGFASYPDVLARAGARDADMIIAATHSDEGNMVTCQGAPATFDTESFMGGKAQLLGIVLDADCPVLNTPLRQLSELFSTLRAIVVGVRRDERLFAPEPGDQLFDGDRIYVFAHTEDLNRTLEIFGKTNRKQERIVIVGAGNVGLAVARALENRTERMRAKVIEMNRDRAEKAADALERTIVLNGDGMDMEILLEAGIDRADAVLAVTDDDKTNLLVAVRAKQAGCPMAVALVNDPTLVPLMDALNIDAFINPRATTVSSILRHIRHGRVRAIYSIGDAEAELIEAQVLSTSPLSGRLIRDIEFPEGVLVGAVMKGDKVMKPTGDLRVEEGDVIALFTMAKDVPEVERLLQVSIDFF